MNQISSGLCRLACSSEKGLSSVFDGSTRRFDWIHCQRAQRSIRTLLFVIGAVLIIADSVVTVIITSECNAFQTAGGNIYTGVHNLAAHLLRQLVDNTELEDRTRPLYFGRLLRVFAVLIVPLLAFIVTSSHHTKSVANHQRITEANIGNGLDSRNLAKYNSYNGHNR